MITTSLAKQISVNLQTRWLWVQAPLSLKLKYARDIRMCSQIPLIFHNGSNCDYHFIIKDLKEEFKANLCFGENTEK